MAGCLNCGKLGCEGHMQRHSKEHLSHHVISLMEYLDWNDRAKVKKKKKAGKGSDGKTDLTKDSWCSLHVNEVKFMLYDNYK